MIFLFLFLIPGALLLVANAAGMIDLDSWPLARIFKWLIVAAWAWFLPLLAQRFFHLQIDERHLSLWKLFILGVLFLRLLSALAKWVWNYYGPAPEGHRRCPRCRKPVLKVMLECPACRKSLS